MVVAFRGPGVEKIRNPFAVLGLENCVDQSSVVFGVRELGLEIKVPWVEVTETDFQTDKEKTLRVLKDLAVLAYHGTPFIRNLRQAARTGFQLDQLAQNMWDKFILRVDKIDG